MWIDALRSRSLSNEVDSKSWKSQRCESLEIDDTELSRDEGERTSLFDRHASNERQVSFHNPLALKPVRKRKNGSDSPSSFEGSPPSPPSPPSSLPTALLGRENVENDRNFAAEENFIGCMPIIFVFRSTFRGFRRPKWTRRRSRHHHAESVDSSDSNLQSTNQNQDQKIKRTGSNKRVHFPEDDDHLSVHYDHVTRDEMAMMKEGDLFWGAEDYIIFRQQAAMDMQLERQLDDFENQQQQQLMFYSDRRTAGGSGEGEERWEGDEERMLQDFDSYTTIAAAREGGMFSENYPLHDSFDNAGRDLSISGSGSAWSAFPEYGIDSFSASDNGYSEAIDKTNLYQYPSYSWQEQAQAQAQALMDHKRRPLYEIENSRSFSAYSSYSSSSSAFFSSSSSHGKRGLNAQGNNRQHQHHNHHHHSRNQHHHQRHLHHHHQQQDSAAGATTAATTTDAIVLHDVSTAGGKVGDEVTAEGLEDGDSSPCESYAYYERSETARMILSC